MDNKVYFNEGDTVKLKRLDSPEMMVVSVGIVGRGDQERTLDGIWCIWFDSHLHVQEYKFNTKDLVKVKKR